MNKDEIAKILSNISKTGYTLEMSTEGNQLGVALFKEDARIIAYNSFFINILSEVSTFKSEITYKSIENIVSPALRKAQIIGGQDGELMPSSSLYRLESKAYEDYFSDFALTISDISSINYLIEKFNHYILEVAEPFYRRWSDLNQLNIFLEHLPQQEIGSVLGQGGTFKKAIVYKLCNNPKFDEYIDMLYNFYTNRYQENPEGDVSYKQWNDVAIAMKEALDKLPTDNLS